LSFYGQRKRKDKSRAVTAGTNATGWTFLQCDPEDFRAHSMVFHVTYRATPETGFVPGPSPRPRMLGPEMMPQRSVKERTGERVSG